jgi:hypothetical protein
MDPARFSHIFVRASEKLLRDYIEPNRHALNCVSCVLRMLQLIDEEAADYYSEKARGTVSGIIGGAESILRESHGDESIGYTSNFKINMQDAKPQVKKVTLDAELFERRKFDISDFSVKRKTKGSTDISRKGYILNIKVRGEDIPVYDKSYTQVYDGDVLVDYAGEEAKLTIIGENSFRNREAFISALNYIPEGCLAVGSLEQGSFDGHRNEYRGTGVYHQIIIGKSGRGNPYIIDGQSSNQAQGIYRGLDAIYRYLKSGNYIHMRYLINDSKICGSVDTYEIQEAGVRPFEDLSVEVASATGAEATAAEGPAAVAREDPASERKISRNSIAKKETDEEWKHDDSSSICPYCGAQFTFWTRRHHCRGCGNLCCGGCCGKTLPLLNSDGTRTEERVCGDCYRDADPSLKGGGRYYKKRKSKRKTKSKRQTKNKRRRKSKRRRR